jgi:hypothetical protein
MNWEAVIKTHYLYKIYFIDCMQIFKMTSSQIFKPVMYLGVQFGQLPVLSKFRQDIL